MISEEYDIIVVGAGHAGSEAAAAAANMGSKTLLITMNLQNIAQMSCNPAMGGIAKGQIIKEILTVNGVRFSFEDGSWGLIRASSNKPSLVIVTESPTSDIRKKEIF